MSIYYTYSFNGGTSKLCVVRRCVKCGRFLSQGHVLLGANHIITLKNWNCSQCGEIQPKIYWRDGFPT